MRIAICGFGHVGRGVLESLDDFPELELCGIFSRRPSAVTAETGVPVWSINDAELVSGSAASPEVVIMCGSSADDLPTMSPSFVRHFNIVDSFDLHGELPQHIASLDAVARASGHLAVTAAGWDPGLLSIARLYFAAVLPRGQTLTQWGPGVSRGHTAMLSHLPGVIDALQLTVPTAVTQRQWELPEKPPSTTDLHRRECYIVAEEGADRDGIVRRIAAHTYFAGCETSVFFVEPSELAALAEQYGEGRHAGQVIHRLGNDEKTDYYLSLRLELRSNARFTGAVLCAAAQAAVRLHRRGRCGCLTLADIPPTLLTTAVGWL